jgi:hypothetical protein
VMVAIVAARNTSNFVMAPSHMLSVSSVRIRPTFLPDALVTPGR